MVYEEGCGPILLDEVQCQGTEATLLACTHSEWGQHDCSHSEDIGVRCETGGFASDIPGPLPPPGKAIEEAKQIFTFPVYEVFVGFLCRGQHTEVYVSTC